MATRVIAPAASMALGTQQMPVNMGREVKRELQGYRAWLGCASGTAGGTSSWREEALSSMV